jgi:hypothetical protein
MRSSRHASPGWAHWSNPYEPRCSEQGVCLTNCPFDRLAKEHTELVCSMNLALVGGLLDGLGCDSLEAVLDPQPGLCCVKAHPRQRWTQAARDGDQELVDAPE